jgi:antirestriction protein ArdC
MTTLGYPLTSLIKRRLYIAACRSRRLSKRTIEAYNYYLNWFESWAKSVTVTDVRAVDATIIRNFLVSIQTSALGKKRSPNTIHGMFRVLRSFYVFLEKEEVVSVSPSLSETGKNLIILFNQEDEADSILASLAPELMKFSRDICKSESKNHPNILSLWASAVNNGWTEGVWATYRQWEELGCQVKRGEKSSPVVFWDSYTDDQAEPDQSVKRSFAKRYSVFNCAQVEGFCPTTPIETVQNEKIAAAEAFFLNLSSDIRVGGNEAGYSKSGDFIRMPGLRQFLKSEGYYCVLSHEHIHWSGHKDRLNRDLSGRFGDSSYAMEGLIAELGVVFLCSHLGVKTDPREDHAGYVASWLRVLKKDNRAIFTAASAAQKAVDYLVQLSQEEPVLVGKALCLETKRVFNLSS